jgi:hypothetical protein
VKQRDVAMPAGWRRRGAWLQFAVTALVLLLPVLVAARGWLSPPTSMEQARLQASLAAESSCPEGEVAGRFYLAFVGDAAWPVDDAPAQQRLLWRARLAQLVGLAGISIWTYLAVLLARGRLQALLATAALGLLPPFAVDGAVLRPETPAAFFGGMSLVLLLGLAQGRRDGRRRQSLAASLAVFGSVTCATVCTGLAVAASPTTGEVLLVPGVVLTVAAIQAGPRGLRALRRRGVAGMPARALNRRLLPWMALALLTPAVAMVVMRSAIAGPTEALVATRGTGHLFPAAGWLHWPLLALAAAGAMVALVRVGVQFGRRGRIGPDLVLLLATAVMVAGSVAGASDEDPLPAAPAVAVWCSEGVRACLVWWRRGAARG